MAVQPVPDADVDDVVAPPRQLPLFEAQRPSRFELGLTGNVELALAMEDEFRMAEHLKLGRKFIVRVTSEKDSDVYLDFFATVTKRTHKRVRHADQGDAVVSAATLTFTGLGGEEE